MDVQFKSEGSKIWADFTAANVGTQTAFVLDSKVVSAPEIQEAIPGGRTQITGQFTDNHGARTGQRAQVRFAAAVVRVVGGRNGFRHTGSVISAGGPDRRCGRPRGGAAVLTALLPRARVAGRTVVGRLRRNGFRDTRAARQIHQLHVGPRGHRRPDHRYRHDRGLVRGVLRAHQRRDTRRSFVPVGRPAWLGQGAQDDSVRQRGYLPGRRWCSTCWQSAR